MSKMKLNLNPLSRSSSKDGGSIVSPRKDKDKEKDKEKKGNSDSAAPTTPKSKILSPRKLTLKSSGSGKDPASLSSSNSSGSFSFSNSSTSDSVILAKLPTLFQNSKENMIVSFRKTDLSDDFWLRFCESLKTNSYLLDLDLSYCGMNAKRLRLLGESLAINNVLIKLNLEGNSLSRKVFREFLEMVFSANFTLQYLEIGSLWDPLASASTISRTQGNQLSNSSKYNYDYENYHFSAVPEPQETPTRSATNPPTPLFGLISPRTPAKTLRSSPGASPATSGGTVGRFRDLESIVSPRKTTFQTPEKVRDSAASPRTIRKHIPLRMVRSEAKLDKFCLTDSSELLHNCLQSNQSIQQCKALESKSLLLSGRFLKSFPMKELDQPQVLTKIIQLDISDNGLTTIPKEIFESLTELRILVCDNNSLTHLNPEVKVLKKLRSLSVRNNRLVNIDPVVELTFLSELDIAMNELKNLPLQIIGLSRLRHLKAFGNPFDENILPKSIVDEGDTNLIYYLRSLADDE